MKKTEQIKEKKENKKYSKNVILNSEQYARYQDVLESQLKQNRLYSLQEIENIVKKFVETTDKTWYSVASSHDGCSPPT